MGANVRIGKMPFMLFLKLAKNSSRHEYILPLDINFLCLSKNPPFSARPIKAAEKKKKKREGK